MAHSTPAPLQALALAENDIEWEFSEEEMALLRAELIQLSTEAVEHTELWGPFAAAYSACFPRLYPSFPSRLTLLAECISDGGNPQLVETVTKVVLESDSFGPLFEDAKATASAPPPNM